LLQEDRIRLGGEKIPVTVFFSDIRSFTSSSEKMAPEAVVEMLNEYMSEMVSVIEKWGGVVDKYVGDAIMAIWGMPTQDPARDAEKAVFACLEMRLKLAELNERRRHRDQPPIQIGMGLNSGEVIAGNIGSPSRMEYTVIGDTVNTASRMESLTKEHKTDFLLNESTAALLTPGRFELLGPIETAAKGKAQSVLVYGCESLAEGLSLEQFMDSDEVADEGAATAEGTTADEADAAAAAASDEERQAA
jgi:adenylate cyclase